MGWRWLRLKEGVHAVFAVPECLRLAANVLESARGGRPTFEPEFVCIRGAQI